MSVLCKNCNNQVTIKTDKCPYCEKPLNVSVASSRLLRGCMVIPILGLFGVIFYFAGPQIQQLFNKKVPDAADISPPNVLTQDEGSAVDTSPPNVLTRGEGTAADAYRGIQKAAAESDILAMRKYLSKSQLELMSETDTSAIMEKLMPGIEMPEPSLAAEHQQGNRAVLVMKSVTSGFTDESGNPSEVTGIIRMVKENGSWKMFDQVWHIHPPTDPLPEALKWLDASSSASSAKVSDLPEGFEYDQDKCFEAIVKTEPKYVRWCLQTGMKPETIWNDDVTAFDFALLHINGNEPGDVEIIEAFLDAGVDVNRPLRAGNTPLMLAALSCRSDIVQTFIERGADPKQKGSNGLDPLWAAQNCPEVQRILTAK